MYKSEGVPSYHGSCSGHTYVQIKGERPDRVCRSIQIGPFASSGALDYKHVGSGVWNIPCPRKFGFENAGLAAAFYFRRSNTRYLEF